MQAVEYQLVGRFRLTVSQPCNEALLPFARLGSLDLTASEDAAERPDAYVVVPDMAIQGMEARAHIDRRPHIK